MYCLRGNHEAMALKDRELEQKGWQGVGEEIFMGSFGVQKLADIPAVYYHWMQKLPLWASVDDFILVHAGLNFNKQDPLEDDDDMMWIRDWYQTMDLEWMKDRFIIHGHTPRTKDEIKDSLQRINETRVLGIDNGCFIQNEHQVFGHLCVFELNSRQLHFEDNCDACPCVRPYRAKT